MAVILTIYYINTDNNLKSIIVNTCNSIQIACGIKITLRRSILFELQMQNNINSSTRKIAEILR